MTRTASALAVLTLTLIARLDSREPLGRLRFPIIRGAPVLASQFPEVGAIVDISGARPQLPLCTGTMIGSDIVLTAAHCLVQARGRSLGFSRPANRTDLLDVEVIPIAATHIHPGFILRPQDASIPTRDIAVIVLARKIDHVAVPTLTLSAAQQPTVGARWSIVGFGPTAVDASPDGLKNTALTSISALKASEFTIAPSPGPQPCFGDSGGPAYPTTGGHAIGGVASRAAVETDSSCTSGTIYTRVDAYSDWIRAVVKQAHAKVSTQHGANTISYPQVDSKGLVRVFSLIK